jgi:hypothetical protein
VPIIWISFSTTSTPEVRRWRNNPNALRKYVGDVVGRVEGASLQELYFEVGRERAHALVADLDDYIDTKAITRILGANAAMKLVLPDQLAEAIKRERGYRGPKPKPRPKPSR